MQKNDPVFVETERIHGGGLGRRHKDALHRLQFASNAIIEGFFFRREAFLQTKHLRLPGSA